MMFLQFVGFGFSVTLAAAISQAAWASTYTRDNLPETTAEIEDELGPDSRRELETLLEAAALVRANSQNALTDTVNRKPAVVGNATLEPSERLEILEYSDVVPESSVESQP